MLWCIGGHRHRPWCRRYPTSDRDISYSDIGTKNVGLNPFIPISEWFRYRHQLPFRYRTKSISDIPISKIDKTFPNVPSKVIGNFISLSGFVPTTFMTSIWHLTAVLRGFTNIVVGYGISDKNLFRYPILCRTLRSSVRYRTFRYQAQSDIADHGFRTECPPMLWCDVCVTPNSDQHASPSSNFPETGAHGYFSIYYYTVPVLFVLYCWQNY